MTELEKLRVALREAVEAANYIHGQLVMWRRLAWALVLAVVFQTVLIISLTHEVTCK